jgi:uncharacterized membrane protein YuzA (DUF378 family)
MSDAAPPAIGGRRRRIEDVAPLPFVGVALLLVVLIIATPVLTGQSNGGGVLTQAELIVDALPGNLSTHYYVRGLSTTARYAEINLGFAYGFNWTGAFPTGPLNWTDWQNASSVLAVDFGVSHDPVAVNVTALYSVGGVNALYAGVLAFDVATPPGSTTAVVTVVSATAGIAGFSTAVTDLPVPILLAYVGTGGTR